MGQRKLRQLTVVTILLALSGWPLQGQTRISGTVVDRETGEPISGVHVQLFTQGWYPVGERVTDEGGVFEIELLRKGTYRIRAERLGYERVETPVFKVRNSSILGIRIHMSVDAIPLAPLEIVARTRMSVSVGDYAGFERRMETGLGHFFTRDDIERIQPLLVSDLLRQVPGVRLHSSGSGRSSVATMSRASRLDGSCPVQLFVDGMLINRPTPAPGQATTMSIDDVVSPHSIQAMEVYKGMASVPAAFITPDSRCGVIAIWTRRGRN